MDERTGLTARQQGACQASTGDVCPTQHDGEEVEEVWFMQEGLPEALNGPWHELLEELRLKLEGYGKWERSQVAGHLLRLLDHRVTNWATGCLLGQVDGRPATLTALLVAMRDDDTFGCKVPAGDPKMVWLRQVWGRVTKFIPQHPGSEAAAGRWPGHELPVITAARWPPLSTPPSSPIAVEDSCEAGVGGTAKRRCMRIELSSGSADDPRTVHLEVPLEGRSAGLRLHFTVQEELTADSPASTVHADTEKGTSLTGFSLPPPAPGGLDTYGLSASDFETLRQQWIQGKTSLGEVQAQQGDYVAGQLLMRWGPPGILVPEGSNTNMVVGEHSPQPSTDPVANAEPAETEIVDPDDSVGLFVWWTVLLPPRAAGSQPEPQVERGEQEFSSLARRVVQQMRDNGVMQVAIASTLMELVWRRRDQDYAMEAEHFFPEPWIGYRCGPGSGERPGPRRPRDGGMDGG